ncbi:MAG TPA: TIGR03435 family protein [Edaphobacter sp.]|nr:TIGR03435 family protein [Edaphobacter sp.]
MTIDDCRHHSCRLHNRRNLLLLTLAISVAALCGYGHAQAPQNAPKAQADSATAKLPVYDVVSIKPNKSGSGNYGFRTGDDSFTATNVPVKFLLENAYDIKPELISGVSGPIDSARFDVIAKMVDPDPDVIKKLSNRQRELMLLPFLEERFQLKAHTETKILPIFEMILTKDGPKFKQSPAPIKPNPTWSSDNGRFTAHDLSMTDMASVLTEMAHRTVIDKTGLTGKYDLTLKWSEDTGSNSTTDTGPSIFTALQEQLGLKLKPAKGPAETLVVEHVEMPSEN